MPLVTGIYTHEGLAALLQGEDVREVVARVVDAYDKDIGLRGVWGLDGDTESFIREQKALLAGMLAGWAKVRMPKLLAEFEVISVEAEVEWSLAPGIVQMLRCDALLRRKSDGLLFILEFKTLASPGYVWQNQWEHNIQILSYCAAVEETRGEPVGGVMIEGLVKGIRKVETAQRSPFVGHKIQNSPFCYGYNHPLKDGETLLSWDYSPKATKTALTWEVVLDHLSELPTLNEQFITMPPIAPVRDQQVRWRRQTIAAEVRWAMAMKEIREVELDVENDPTDATAREQLAQLLDFHAPQHDNHCLRYGSPCAFTDVCFNSLIEADPLGSGLYQQRLPHHDTELAHVNG